MEKFKVNQEIFNQLEDELNELKTIKRPEIVKRLATDRAE
jgi:transcription elongation GreA/GreB family factor